jgi:predicted acyl esterase
LRQRLIERWLDYWLKGEQNGIMDEPPIQYALRPGWDHGDVEAMPPSDVETRTLYLRSGGKLSKEPAPGPDTHANVSNRPLKPGYTLASAIDDDMAGVKDGLAREVVSFEADPLDVSADILGAPAAQFYMLPNRPFLQVHAELYDVGPDGEETLISRGHYGTRSAAPGRHVGVRIHLRAIAYRLEAGHHLRLDVSNYDTVYAFPYFEPFYSRLFHDNEHPSAIEIPVRGSGR